MFIPGMSGIALDAATPFAISSEQFDPSLENNPSPNAVMLSIRRNKRAEAQRRVMTAIWRDDARNDNGHVLTPSER